MLEFDPDSLPSDRHLRAIGLVAVIWSGIESSMEVAICGLYKIDLNRGLVLTANIGFQSRLALLRILARQGAIADKKHAKACEALLARIEKAYPLRNETVHSLWSPTKGDPTKARRMAIRAKGNQLRTEVEDKTAEELEEIARLLGVLSRDWRDLMEGLGLFSGLKAR